LIALAVSAQFTLTQYNCVGAMLFDFAYVSPILGQGNTLPTICGAHPSTTRPSLQDPTFSSQGQQIRSVEKVEKSAMRQELSNSPTASRLYPKALDQTATTAVPEKSILAQPTFHSHPKAWLNFLACHLDLAASLAIHQP